MNAALPYAIPKEPGRARAIALAAGVHLLLLAFLWIGVRWQNETPIAVEAEIWSPQVREAAPLPKPEASIVLPPAIQAPIRPAPEPVPAPAPVEKVLPDETPDIALEQMKKRKAAQRKEQLREEQREQEKIKKQADEKRLAADKVAQQKLQRDQMAKQQAAKEQAAREQAAKELTLLKKAAQDKKRLLADTDKKQLDKLQADEMNRIQAGVAGTGGAGTAPKSQGGRADPGYVQKVGARIKSNTVFNVSDDLEGNPAVEYAVDLLPDGSIRSIRKTKSSAIAGFDDAVRRAIEKSAPFPADKSGIAPASFTITHRPKDS